MPREVVENLSSREREVLRLAMDGKTDGAIATELQIGEGTVGTYWGRIRAKMGPYPRTELIAIHMRLERERELGVLSEALDEAEERYRMAAAAEGFFHQVLDAADEGVLVLSQEGRVLHANPMAHQILGYAADALAGLMLTEIVPKHVRQTHAQFFQNATSLGHVGRTIERQEMFGVTDGQERVCLSVSVSIVETGGVKLVSCYFVESPRHRAA